MEEVRSELERQARSWATHWRGIDTLAHDHLNHIKQPPIPTLVPLAHGPAFFHFDSEAKTPRVINEGVKELPSLMRVFWILLPLETLEFWTIGNLLICALASDTVLFLIAELNGQDASAC